MIKMILTVEAHEIGGDDDFIAVHDLLNLIQIKDSNNNISSYKFNLPTTDAAYYTNKLWSLLMLTLPIPTLIFKCDRVVVFPQSKIPATLKDSTLSLRVSSNGLNFQPSACNFLELNEGSWVTWTNLPLVGEQNICSTSDCNDDAISKFTMPQNQSKVQWNSMSNRP